MNPTERRNSLPGTSEGHGRLPNAAYTDPKHFERECRSVLSATWQFAGRAGAIPNPGDITTATVAGSPIFLVRQASGEIGAFHNVCPHRGAKIVPAPCSVARLITCPLSRLVVQSGRHSARSTSLLRCWPARQGRAGDGIARPRLWSIRAELFFDWVFVNLDGQAKPLAEALHPLIERLQGYDFSGCVFGGEIAFDVPCNWKLAHENFFDILHKIAIHPELQKAAPITTNVRYAWLSDRSCGHAPPSGEPDRRAWRRIAGP